MTNALDELRGLLDASTPGPWGVPNDDTPDDEIWLIPVVQPKGSPVESEDGADAALIVFLRNHAEDLLAVPRNSELLAHAARRMVSGLEPESECKRGCTPGSTGPDTEGPWQCEEHYLADALAGYDRALARLSPTSEEGS